MWFATTTSNEPGRERQCLNICDDVLGAFSKLAPRGLDHPRREVGKRERPARVDPLAVGTPKRRRPAAHIEDLRARPWRLALEEPLGPTGIRREARVERDARLQVSVCCVLLSLGHRARLTRPGVPSE